MALKKLLVGIVLVAEGGMPLARAALAIGIAAALLQPAARGAVQVTSVGATGFQVTDTHLYAAPGDFPSFAALFPDHFPTRLQHGPPYDQEFADGLAITGFPESEVFSVSQFTAPSAVHLGFILVPSANAPAGSSQDFVSGPIIPNAILPIDIQGDVFLNGAPYEQGAFWLEPDSRGRI